MCQKNAEIHWDWNTDWGNTFSLRMCMSSTWSSLIHLLVSPLGCLIQTHLSCWWNGERKGKTVWFGTDGWDIIQKKQIWANISHTTVNSISLSSLESIYFRDFTFTIGRPRKCQEIHKLICSSQDENRWRVRIASTKWTCFQPDLSFYFSIRRFVDWKHTIPPLVLVQSRDCTGNFAQKKNP